MHTYTWNKLVKNTHILRPWTPQPTPRFEKELILPYVGTKSVLVKLKAWGVTEKNIHNVTLLFGDCEILEGDHPELSLREYFKLTYQGKVYYIKKFSALKNPLTWRCTCFTGDTKILMADGSTKTFIELINYKKFEVKSYFSGIYSGFYNFEAGNCSIKQPNAKIIRLTFDDGYQVRCTPDHKFMESIGVWNEARNLLNKRIYSMSGSKTCIKIEDAGYDDVYCITVPQTENFTLENGLVVHNCSDSYYTWSWASSKYGNCLYGPPPRPYKRKTKTRPPRNPRNLIGVCKHVHNAWYYLRNAGLTLD